jgi:uncharacterized membrane protein
MTEKEFKTGKLCPPVGFGVVEDRLFRSGVPDEMNFEVVALASYFVFLVVHPITSSSGG